MLTIFTNTAYDFIGKRPVVVVPHEPTEGTGVLVAYGGGREAARTLQTFESLGLAGGEIIDVVTVHRDRAEGEAIAALAGNFLAAHSAPHRLHTIVTGSPPAEVVLEGRCCAVAGSRW